MDETLSIVTELSFKFKHVKRKLNIHTVNILWLLMYQWYKTERNK